MKSTIKNQTAKTAATTPKPHQPATREARRKILVEAAQEAAGAVKIAPAPAGGSSSPLTSIIESTHISDGKRVFVLTPGATRLVSAASMLWTEGGAAQYFHNVIKEWLEGDLSDGATAVEFVLGETEQPATAAA